MKKIFYILFVITLSISTGAKAQAGGNNSATELYKEYKKIDVTAVPADVLKKASERYQGYSVSEALVSEKNEYKLVLTIEKKAVIAYYKSTGEFIKDEVK